jgi:competence protein ComEC
LIDGGGSADYDVGKKILLPYLLKNGVSHIDLACVTHLHQDHFGGLVSLCHLMPVRKLALYEGNRSGQQKILDETGLSAKELLYLKKGDSIFVEKGVRIDILYPEGVTAGGGGTQEMAETDENAATLVIRIAYQGVGILLTGDLGFSGEESIEEFYRGSTDSPAKADILKIGHHVINIPQVKPFLISSIRRSRSFRSDKIISGIQVPTSLKNCEKKI